MIHLNTVIGSRITTLKPLLQHYRMLGIQSFLVNVHLSHEKDTVLEEVRAIVKSFGIDIASITTGRWQEVIRMIYDRSRARYPRDWHILCDQDEFHVYPAKPEEIVRLCEKNGYDYVCGCFVDRIAEDGTLPQIDPECSVWEQFPLGSFLSYPLAGAHPGKVVLARSHVEIVKGQHVALSGRACPMTACLVQVHHFKWVGGLISKLIERSRSLAADGYRHAIESERIVTHLRARGDRIDLSDPRFLVAPCSPDYPNWPIVKDWITIRNHLSKLISQMRNGPAQLAVDLDEIQAEVARLAESVRLRG